MERVGTHVSDGDRAPPIGEELGLDRDDPMSKGCASPFAPIAITEVVSPQG